MNSRAQWKLPVLLLAIALAGLQPALAFEYPLSSDTIREAYFLGKSSAEKRAAFLAKYRRDLPAPATGPDISVVEIQTPFSVVVTRASSAISNYFAPDAEEEFLGKPGVFRVHVEIDLTASYGWQIVGKDGGIRSRPDDFWRDFKIQLTQKGEEIPSQRVDGQPIYDSGEDEGTWLAGATVEIEYDPAKIDSATPATVDVFTPDGQDVQTTFDLAELR